MQIVAVTDPLQLGFTRQAMIGPAASQGTYGPSRTSSPDCDEVDYVVICAGSFDLLVEVVCEDDDHLLRAPERVDSRRARSACRPRRSSISSWPSRPTPGGPDDGRPDETPVTPPGDTEDHDITSHDDHGDHDRLAGATTSLPSASAATARSATCGCTSAASAPTTDHEVPVIVRGEGPYVWDQRRQAVPRRARRARSRASSGTVGPSWPRRPESRRASWPTSRSGPTPTPAPSSWPSAWRASRRATCNRVFFTTGGSEAVESAWKLARQYFRLIGQPDRYKVAEPGRSPITARRWVRLSITGIPSLRAPFEPLVPGADQGPQHQLLPGARARRRRRGLRPVGGRRDRAGHRARGPRHRRRRLPRAGAERRRLLPAAARLLRAGARRSATDTGCSSCPTRSSAPSGGSASGSARSRYGYQPDIITVAKGLTSGYAPLGAMIVERPPRRAVPARRQQLPPRLSPSPATP